MNQKRIDEVIAILSSEDTAGKPFAEAREKLLQEGYTESEIVGGVYQFPYDGVPNQQRVKSEMAQYYDQHPDQAGSIAKNLLNEIALKERDALIAKTVASQIGDRQTTSYYSVQLADEIGYPYFTMLFLSLGLTALGFKYKWLHSLVALFGLLANIYFSWLLWQRWKSTRPQK